jgi:D-psicose/D-tagatose/L-ribulose 3-epimerase
VRALNYAFPLSIQTMLPAQYREGSFRQTLDLLAELGFSGVELNSVRPNEVDPVDLRALLDEHGLQMTMFASGATAKAQGLSLSNPDERVRSHSVDRCISLLDFASEMGAGVIAGFLKGPVYADPERANAQFQKSIAEIAPHVQAKEVPLLIEATNHYETSVIHSLHQAAELIDALGNPFLRVLPDTYHMNIEERSMFGSLVKFGSLYDSLHISDNNRLFPGLGAIDFFAILRFLKEIGYRGGIAIEGNIQDSFERDLRASMSVLAPMLLAV